MSNFIAGDRDRRASRCSGELARPDWRGSGEQARRYTSERSALVRGQRCSRAGGVAGEVGASGGGAVQLLADLFQQTRQVDRLGVVVIATGGEGALAVALHGMSGQSDQRDVAGLGIG